jgi:hypothetical protein
LGNFGAVDLVAPANFFGTRVNDHEKRRHHWYPSHPSI